LVGQDRRELRALKERRPRAWGTHWSGVQSRKTRVPWRADWAPGVPTPGSFHGGAGSEMEYKGDSTTIPS
jgi:hypothetical protein